VALQVGERPPHHQQRGLHPLDAGVGLLFDLAHLGRSTLLRVDAAVPDDGTGITITVSTSTLFRLPVRIR
jgi:hypothetical protein